MILGLILALILTLLHFASGLFVKFTKKYNPKLLSFSAGILISILFLEIFPSFVEKIIPISTSLFILPLLGFVAFHSIRAYNIKHIQTKKELKKRFRKSHILAFFIEHFTIGFALVSLTIINPSISIFLFIPFILLTISSSIILRIIDKTSKTSMPKIILASSTLIGAVVGMFLSFNSIIYLATLGYATGALFYIISRDIIPAEERKENMTFFYVGLILTIILLLI
jgi:hypothetical protein